MIQQLLDALAAVLKWWTVVTPWEQGLRVRAGKHVTLLHAGVYLKLPLIDQVFIQTTRRRFSAVPTQDLTTVDGKTVTVAGSLGYSILDVQKLYATLHHGEATLEAEAQGVISDYITDNVYEDLNAQTLREHVVEHLDFDRYGIGEVDFVLTTLVCARTFRLLQSAPTDYTKGEVLDTEVVMD